MYIWHVLKIFEMKTNFFFLWLSIHKYQVKTTKLMFYLVVSDLYLCGHEPRFQRGQSQEDEDGQLCYGHTSWKWWTSWRGWGWRWRNRVGFRLGDLVRILSYDIFGRRDARRFDQMGQQRDQTWGILLWDKETPVESRRVCAAVRLQWWRKLIVGGRRTISSC